MHGNYQLEYCLITQIISFAFCDGAFLNTELTPELIWQLRVPKCSLSLPLCWKTEVLNMPLLQRLERTPYGYELHLPLPMTHDSSQQALWELGWDARFEDDICYYNYRHWTANEVNCMSPIEHNLTELFQLFMIRLFFLICCLQGISPAKSSKECWDSLVTRFLKSITNHSLLHAIFSMLSSSDHLRKVCYGLLEACSGKEIP